jgi:replicative superfamily II helicase
LPYYDIDEIENEILEQQKINILISTPEKLDFLVRSGNKILNDLKIVVLDEAHNLSDETRGSKFELLLATLKQKYKGLQYLLLTPFVKEKSAQQISEWLADTPQASSVIASEWSPSKQYMGYAIFKKDYSQIIYLPSARNNIVKEDIIVDVDNNPDYVKDFLNDNKKGREHKTIVLLEKYLNIGNCTLVLCETVLHTKKTAIAVLMYVKKKKLLNDISHNTEIRSLIDFMKEEDAGNEELIQCLKYGIAFHNAKMSQHLKERIEFLVGEGLIKVLCATTTLAQGMNFPITNVIFQFYARSKIRNTNDKRTKKQRALTSSEFMNIAGRAGRAYYDSEGHIILSQSADNETHQELKEQLSSYIQDDKKNIISALTNFFKLLDTNADINLQMLNSNQSVTNFLQYINHIIRVVYNNKFDRATQELSQILNSSLIYKQLGKKEGFIESQQKIRDFSKKYIEKIKDKNTGELKLADLNGISDISLSFLSGKIRDYKKELKEENKNISEYMNIHNIITKDKKYQRLSKLIEIISSIPEMKMEIGNTKGKFNADRVAIMIIEWVNGNSISQISSKLKTELSDNREFEKIIDESNKYINGTMKNFIPWGVKIYQVLTEKENERHENLPSYIYYGVNDNESVILSKLNIPRFMIKKYKERIYSQFGKDFIKVSNMNLLKEFIKEK